MESIVHMRVLKTRSYLDSAGSASRIDSDERRYFSVPIRLYLFIYFYLDDLHFSDKIQGNALERFQRFISTFPRALVRASLDFGDDTLASPFVHQRNIEI